MKVSQDNFSNAAPLPCQNPRHRDGADFTLQWNDSYKRPALLTFRKYE